MEREASRFLFSLRMLENTLPAGFCWGRGPGRTMRVQNFTSRLAKHSGDGPGLKRPKKTGNGLSNRGERNTAALVASADGAEDNGPGLSKTHSDKPQKNDRRSEDRIRVAFVMDDRPHRSQSKQKDNTDKRVISTEVHSFFRR